MFDFTEHHFDRIMDVLGQIHRRVTAMAIDVSKLTAAEVQLVADVDVLLAASTAATTQLAAVSAQLAAAIAANDPAALARRTRWPRRRLLWRHPLVRLELPARELARKCQ